MDLMPTLEALIDHIDQPGIDADPSRDIITLDSDISQLRALEVQLGVKRRRVAAGDRIIGHQASFTSAGIRKLFQDAPCPMVGTLLASLVRQDGDEVTLECEEAYVESEFALLLKRDLEGSNITAVDVLAATEAYLPAIEIAPLRPGVLERRYSWPHMIAVQKAVGGYVVFGSKLTSPHRIDPRLEGCHVRVDGMTGAAATGFEAMGSPLTVVAEMAKTLSAIGEKLHAGQLIMTGTLAPPQLVNRSSRIAQLAFQSLGSVCVRFSNQEGMA